MGTHAAAAALVVFLIMISTVVGISAGDGGSSLPIFFLGDSIADVGTNNYLNHSFLTSNFPQYGVDFPNSLPTGRFSNGLNSADFLAKLFGHKMSPKPFLFMQQELDSHHFKKHIIKGINFASAGAGILDSTFENLTVVPLSAQITQLSWVQSNITATIGQSQAEEIMAKSLFFITIGSNDILYYFLNRSQMSQDEFINLLTSTYSDHITNLYNLGARKFGIVGVGPLGCCPVSRYAWKNITGTEGCFGLINVYAQAFHSGLDGLLRNISTQLPGIKYSLGNTYNMTLDVINNAQMFGFENLDSSCCGYGDFGAERMCDPKAPLCSDRRKYLFWDMYHPTQKAANLATQKLYDGELNYVYPFNFSQLAAAA